MRKPVTFVLAPAALIAAALSLVLAAPAGAHSLAGRHTVRQVVRPVHSNGTPVAGWAVQKQNIPEFTCTEGPSPVAVDNGIRFCGPSATYTVACWKSTHHTVLCLRNPMNKKLVRIRYVGAYKPVKAPARPSPQTIALYNGVTCLIRDGGAWGAVKGHPKWTGDYSCSNGTAVYGRGRDGIVRSSQPWRVHTVRFHSNGDQTIRTRAVHRAFYVGTAA